MSKKKTEHFNSFDNGCYGLCYLGFCITSLYIFDYAQSKKIHVGKFLVGNSKPYSFSTFYP